MTFFREVTASYPPPFAYLDIGLCSPGLPVLPATLPSSPLNSPSNLPLGLFTSHAGLSPPRRDRSYPIAAYYSLILAEGGETDTLLRPPSPLLPAT